VVVVVVTIQHMGMKVVVVLEDAYTMTLIS